MKRISIIAFAIALALPAFAQWKMPEVYEHGLDNGMRILVVEREGSPTFHAHIGFKTGSINEKPGYTGMAHMLEHMLFKGTEVMGTKSYGEEKPVLDKLDELFGELREAARDEINDASRIAELRDAIRETQERHRTMVLSEQLWSLYQKNGGENLNASTGRDITNYLVSLPSNRLELWAWLESDRMRSPVFREFYRERDVIAEERRMRVDSDPTGMLFETLFGVAYFAHPYRLPTIGYMSDIQHFTREGLAAFHKLNYAPNRTVVVLVGDLEHEKVFEVCDRYFGDLERQPAPPPILPDEPPQEGERRVDVHFKAEPRIAIGYHVPEMGHPDLYALEVLSGILSEGRTSRLYRSLVREQQIAVSANTFVMDGRGPGLFIVMASPRHPHSASEVEEGFYQQLAGVTAKSITEHELQKVKNNMEADFIRGLGSNMGMAHALGYYAVVKDVDYLRAFLDNINRVTADDVERVAGMYLAPTNRTVVTLVKKEGESS